MSRQFGLTSDRAVGGNQPGRSHSAHDTQRAELILFPSGTPLERREVVKPTPDELEAGSFRLFLVVIFVPPLIVWAVVLGYLKLVA